MITMYLKGGSTEYITNDNTMCEEFGDMLDDKLGRDAREMYEDIIYYVQHPMGEPTAGDNYEAIADDYYGALMDTYNSLGELIDRIDNAKRLDKTQLVASLKSIAFEIGQYV